jgi:YjbE family integral membrane protein
MAPLASLNELPWMGPLLAFLQVVLIDLGLAGDNAVAVGIAAAGLEESKRRRVILVGMIGAVVMRIGLALIALHLLALIGLLFAGGLLLLWVAWRMWRDIDSQARAARERKHTPAKSFGQALVQIIAADLFMSLDNVLAVAGASHGNWLVLVFGLLLSIALMGVAANFLARVLNRVRWIAYVGVALVTLVALHMMWDGYRGVVVKLNQTGPYNAIMPDWLDIGPAEAAKHRHAPGPPASAPPSNEPSRDH